MTLLKAEPLTPAEVNQYGTGHVNRYTQESVGTADNYHGYGGMAYYTSETCGYVNGSSVYDGCTTDYDASDVKYVVDNWAQSKLVDVALKNVDGYSARLITIDELTGLGYVQKTNQYNDINYFVNNNIPVWVYNNLYDYWTMSKYRHFSEFIFRVQPSGNVDNISILSNYISVRPVINVYKSTIQS